MAYQTKAYTLIQALGFRPLLNFSSIEKAADFIARHEDAIGDWQVWGSRVNKMDLVANVTTKVRKSVNKIRKKENILGTDPLPSDLLGAIFKE